MRSILLIDDDIDDHVLFRDALLSTNKAIRLELAANGVDALEKLNSSSSLPELIFLDMNMPKMDGKQCIDRLKSDDRFRLIPVIMYSTSASPQDELDAIAAGAVWFIQKPNGYEEFCEIVKFATEQEW